MLQTIDLYLYDPEKVTNMIVLFENGHGVVFSENYAPPLIETIHSTAPIASEETSGGITCYIVVLDKEDTTTLPCDHPTFNLDSPILSLGIYPTLVTDNDPPPSFVRHIPITQRPISA